MSQTTDQPFTLPDLISLIGDMLALVEDAENLPEQDRWLIVYEVHSIIYTVIVHQTCIDLYNFPKLASYYEVTNMSSAEWLTLFGSFLRVFQVDCQKEFEAYGG